MRVSGVWARAGCGAIMSNDKVETQTSHSDTAHITSLGSRHGEHNAQAVDGNSAIFIITTLNDLFVLFQISEDKTKLHKSFK